MKKVFLILFAAITFFSSCKDESPVEPPGSTPEPTPSGIYLKPNAYYLDTNEAGYISSVTSNSITFSSTNEKISNLKLGDVVCVGVSSKTPNGLLFKISGINKIGNTEDLTFSIIRAALEDLIEEGRISFNKNLFSMNQPLSTTLSSGNAEVILSGNFSETGNISGYLDFEEGSLTDMSMKFSFTGSCDLNLDANFEGSFSKTKTIYNHTFGVVPLWPTPPIVIVPVVTLSAKVEGDFSANLYSGAKNVINSSITLKYDNGWTIEKSLGNTFTFEGVDVTSDANAKVKIIGSVSFLLEGVAGPQIGLEPYTRLNAKTTPTPKWTLYKGVDATAGISTGWLSSFIPGKTWTFNLSESELASGTFGDGGNNPPPPPSNPSPSDGAVNVQSPVTVSWNCSDPDGDPLHYSLIAGIDGELPVRFNNISQKSYNLGSFTGNKQVHWKIVAFDSHGDSTHGDLWTFWTGSGGGGQTVILQPGPVEGKDAEVILFILNGQESYVGIPDRDSVEVSMDQTANNLIRSELLIQFVNVSQVPAGSHILLAKLKLYGKVFGEIGEAQTISLVKLISSWEESTVRWDNKPPYTSILSKNLNPGNWQWREFDVKEVVQSWVNGESSYGFGLKSDQNLFFARFRSSDYISDPSKRPILEITYE